MSDLPVFDFSELSGLDLRPALEETAQTLIELTGADQVFVYAAAGADPLLDPLFALGPLSLSEKQAFWSTPLDPATDVLAGDLLQNPDPVMVSNPAERKRYNASFLAALKAQSFLAFALANRSAMLGMVIFGWLQSGRRPAPDQVRLAGAVVRSMALALDNGRLYELASQQLLQARSLQQITQAILQKTDLQEVLSRIASQAVQLTAALGCAIRLVESGRLELARQEGKPISALVPPTLEQTWHPETVWQRKDPLLFNLDSSDEGITLLAIPLSGASGSIGLLELYQRRTYLAPQDIQTARAFAGQAAVAIEHARLYRTAQETAVSEERARLARDLHDSISQSLYAASLYTRAAERHLSAANPQAASSLLHEIGQTVHAALGEMRLLIFELRPPILEQAGLFGALQARLKLVEERVGLETSISAPVDLTLSRPLEETLYRIAQEALNNILRHASASRVEIRLTPAPPILTLEIEDNGKGFDPLAALSGGQGLVNMRERAAKGDGRLEIFSRPGGGTCIFVEVPYGKNPNSVGG